MTTLLDGAELRIGDDPRPWLWLAMVALLGVLACTAILGMVLAPRWPDAWSISALTQRASTTPVMRSSASPASTVAPSSSKSGDAAAPAIRRPMAYSSVDTRTLATARAHEDMLAGRRAPVEFVVEDLPAPPAVVAAPPISPPTARSRVAAQTSERPTPAIVPAPRPVPPTRMEVARRTPPVEAARRSGPEPLGAGERSTPPRRVPDRPDSPAYARIDRSNAPTIVDRQDAAALDDRWQRRELWFRERLQAR